MQESIQSQKCSCGLDITSKFIYPSPTYGALGWMALLFGATPPPKKITYYCTRCQECLGSTTEPQTLKDFR